MLRNLGNSEEGNLSEHKGSTAQLGVMDGKQ